jgi:hypothetical protein
MTFFLYKGERAVKKSIPSPPMKFFGKNGILEEIFDFFGQKITFFRNFFGPFGIFTNLQYNFQKCLTPPPPKNFPQPLPSPLDFWPGSCMI